MSLPKLIAERINGNKKVKLTIDRDNICLSVTDNGWQWTSVFIDEEIKFMIIDVFCDHEDIKINE